MSETPQTSVKSADRVLDLFELLAHAGREISHSDIAETLQIPKSSLTQLLKNLIARGYVETTVSGRGYRLGATLLGLSHSAGRARDLVAQVDAFLADVTRDTGESSALSQRKGDQAEVMATVLGPARLVTHMRLGDLAPLYATSGGKAILAHLPKESLDEYLGRVRFTPATPATLRSARALRLQLARVRDSGFSYSHEEWTPGIVGIGVAVLDGSGNPLGAINVAIPAIRFDSSSQAKAEAALRRVTDDLRRHLIPKRSA